MDLPRRSPRTNARTRRGDALGVLPIPLGASTNGGTAMPTHRSTARAAAALLVLLASPALAEAPYSPSAGSRHPQRPLFGDTHVHTSFSMDAGAFGARLGPADAYRFAKGEEVTASSGQRARLSRPLDFLVVSDHSDNMGFFPDLFAGKPAMLADPTGKRWNEMIHNGKGNEAALEIIVSFSHGTFPKDLIYSPGTKAYRNAWEETI